MVLLTTTGLSPLNHVDDFEDNKRARVPKEKKKKKNHNHDDIFLFFAMIAVPFIGWYEIPTYVFLGAIALLSICFILYIFHWPNVKNVSAYRAAAFKPEDVPSDLDTIVIGSGSGGSTCAK